MNLKNSFISFDDPAQTFLKKFKDVKAFSSKGFTILVDGETNISARKLRDNKLNQTIPALLLDSKSDFKLFLTKTIRIKLKSSHNKEDVSKLLKEDDVIETKEKIWHFAINYKRYSQSFRNCQ